MNKKTYFILCFIVNALFACSLGEMLLRKLGYTKISIFLGSMFFIFFCILSISMYKLICKENILLCTRIAYISVTIISVDIAVLFFPEYIILCSAAIITLIFSLIKYILSLIIEDIKVYKLLKLVTSDEDEEYTYIGNTYSNDDIWYEFSDVEGRSVTINKKGTIKQ